MNISSTIMRPDRNITDIPPHAPSVWDSIRAGLHRRTHTHSHTDAASDRAILNNRAGICTGWLALILWESFQKPLHPQPVK